MADRCLVSRGFRNRRSWLNISPSKGLSSILEKSVISLPLIVLITESENPLLTVTNQNERLVQDSPAPDKSPPRRSAKRTVPNEEQSGLSPKSGRAVLDMAMNPFTMLAVGQVT